MSVKLSMFLLITFMLPMPSQKQPHLKHQWEHRVLLVISEDSHTEAYQKQIESLYSDLNALEERKLIVYQINRNSYKQGFNEQSQWVQDIEWYRIYANDKKSLEILLFGLDGGKKLYAESFITLEKIIATIDAMPMRQAEMHKKN